MKKQPDVSKGKDHPACHKQHFLYGYIIYTLLMIFIYTGTVSAQVHKFTEEQMKDFTAFNPYGRFPDGRPMIPYAVLDTVRQMQIQVIEAIEVLKAHNYNNQYEGDWKILIPGKKITGRAFTVQFLPTRPDMEEGMKSVAARTNTSPVSKANTIDMLQKDDLAVIDLYGKIEGGLPYVGDEYGILAIPPQFVSEVIKTTITNRRRDVWIKKAFDLGRYKSSEIYGNIKDPALAKQFSDYKATGDPKFLPE